MARPTPTPGTAAPTARSAEPAADATPYNAGWRRAADPRGHHDDCPYRATLVARERAEWLRGFSAGRGDRVG
ncbi:hypothetical protein KZ813_17470 [Sphingomonas sp. RHCKR7]|uniref:hypothetical protein n=1 Tax=Sphingomonas folli TaxID=2862497 RepID=UPI001CA5B678|nr:hypothetical protein [Sphingomonas folli]MBW6528634.1 hypothetical protein [Sphingomonas folli]